MLDESKLVPVGKPLLINVERHGAKLERAKQEHGKDLVLRYLNAAEGIYVMVVEKKELYLKRENGTVSSAEKLRSEEMLHALIVQLHDKLWPDHDTVIPGDLRGQLDVLTEQLKDLETRDFVKLALIRAEMGTVDPRSQKSHEN